MSDGISILYTDNPDVLINLGPNEKRREKRNQKRKWKMY